MYKKFLIALIVTGGFWLTAHGQGCRGGDDEEGLTIAGFIQSQLEYNQTSTDDELTFTFNRARIGCRSRSTCQRMKYLVSASCKRSSHFGGVSRMPVRACTLPSSRDIHISGESDASAQRTPCRSHTQRAPSVSGW